VTVLLGNGDGTFKAPLTIPTRDSVGTVHKIVSVAAGDINGDNHQDIVAASGDGTVTILLGNGNGLFGRPVVFSALTPIWALPLPTSTPTRVRSPAW